MQSATDDFIAEQLADYNEETVRKPSDTKVARRNKQRRDAV